MTYTIGVVAHVDRAEQARYLARTVRAAYLSIDDGEHGCERNHALTWKWLAGYPTEWAVVLEDDAIPVDGFLPQLTAALNTAPSRIVSLYRGHNVNNVVFEKAGLAACERADERDACWIMADQLLHAVAVAMHTDLIGDMLNHIDRLPNDFPADERLSHFARSAKIKPAYSWPSLVDHADNGTVIHKHHRRDKLHRPKGRVAYRVGSRTAWTSDTVTL